MSISALAWAFSILSAFILGFGCALGLLAMAEDDERNQGYQGPECNNPDCTCQYGYPNIHTEVEP